jgi:hypothetical protein
VWGIGFSYLHYISTLNKSISTYYLQYIQFKVPLRVEGLVGFNAFRMPASPACRALPRVALPQPLPQPHVLQLGVPEP